MRKHSSSAGRAFGVLSAASTTAAVLVLVFGVPNAGLTAAAAQTHEVKAEDGTPACPTAPPTTPWCFVPAAITIQAGDTVQWKNTGDLSHSVVADDDSFESPVLNPGETWSKTFSSAGEFEYHCGLHGTVQSGTVTVQGSGSTTTTAGGGGGASTTSSTAAGSGGSQNATSQGSGPATPAAASSGDPAAASVSGGAQVQGAQTSRRASGARPAASGGLPATGIEATVLFGSGSGALALGLLASARTRRRPPPV